MKFRKEKHRKKKQLSYLEKLQLVSSPEYEEWICNSLEHNHILGNYEDHPNCALINLYLYYKLVYEHYRATYVDGFYKHYYIEVPIKDNNYVIATLCNQSNYAWIMKKEAI